jgi:hypothetical protein
MAIIKLSQEDIDICIEFSNSINTSHYASRNQFNDDKRKLDQQVGKFGEIAVYKYLKLKNYDVSYPDFQIYSASKKSWDYDLKTPDINFHVKSQSITQGNRYGISWLFQLGDKHVMTNYKDNDYIAFTSVDMDNFTVNIRSILQVAKLHQLNLFKPPKLPQLFNKCAVYLNDLEILKQASKEVRV